MTPQSLQTNIVFLCGDFVHMFHHSLTRAFKANRIPVTIEQFSILAILFYQNGINQKEIGRLLGRDKTTITRIGVITITKRTKKSTMPSARSRLCDADSLTVCLNPEAVTTIGSGV